MPRRAFTRLLSAAGLAACLVTALAPGLAMASEAVELRSDLVSHGASIKLGDLFAGVSGPAAGIVVAHAARAAGLQAVLEADSVASVAHSAGLDWTNPRGLRRIIVTAAAGDEPLPTPQPARRERAAGVARIHAEEAHAEEARAEEPHSDQARARQGRASLARGSQSLVYARNIMAGEIIAAADLQWSDQAVADADTPGDPDFAIGKAARRPLRGGAVLEARDLINPIAVRRNDAIDVSFDEDGVTLTLEARAMNDGAVGDTIQVTNSQSKKVIEAVVSGPGRAAVGPQAEALKAQAFSPNLRTASLR